MTRKIILCVLCFVLMLSQCAFAQESSGGKMTDAAKTQQETTGTQPPQMNGQTAPGMQPSTESTDGKSDTAQPPQPQTEGEISSDAQSEFPQGGFPQGGFGDMPQFGGMNMQNNQNNDAAATPLDILKEYATPIISVVLLGFAFVFVTFYKRKKY